MPFTQDLADKIMSDLACADGRERGARAAKKRLACPDHVVDGTVCATCGFVCFTCGDSGFSGVGTGYDSVCDDCGGQSASGPSRK